MIEKDQKARQSSFAARRGRLRFVASTVLLAGVIAFLISTHATQLPREEGRAETSDVAQIPVVEAAEAPTTEAVEASAAEAPAVETQIAEAPAAETPAAEAPAVETQIAEAPTAEAPTVETPTVAPPVAETSSGRKPPELALANPSPVDAHATAETIVYHYEIQGGDTLSGILGRYNLLSAMRHLLALDKEQRKVLARLMPGRPLELEVRDDTLVRLTYRPTTIERITVSQRADGGYRLARHVTEVEKREVFASAEINASLYLAGKRSGLSDKIIVEMAGILGWDVDFVYGIRKGDRFTVLYEESYVNGEKWKDNHVVAIKFLNRKKTYRVVRYTDAAGATDYYSASGRKMRKPFLRSPLAFSRISSHFNPRRMHPVLHTIRAHKGVDYAAKRGTPVHATGDGRIIHRARKGGYGKTVIIRHHRSYSTLYAHLSRYARGQKTGSYVKQKQVIGYVGSTGLSTGPHLHYEFRVGGVHKNPITVKLPDSRPLPKAKRPHFDETTRAVLARLERINDAYVASLDKPGAR